VVTVSNSKIIHATLGPDGTYSSQAAKQMMGVEGELLFYPTIGEVFKAVLSGEVQKGIVPILNSGEGPVNPTMMALIACGALVQIEEEFVLPINHVLVTRPGYTLEDVQVVYSHPQALGQCRRYLNGNLPNTRTVESNSTVAAVPDMLGSSVPAAAIAPQSVLKLYEGEIVPIKIGIQDNSHNETRFVMIGKVSGVLPGVTGQDITYLSFGFDDEDQPCLLQRALSCFSSLNINLRRVESRPDPMGCWKDIFILEAEGHREDPVMQAALASLRYVASTVTIWGSCLRATHKRIK